MMMMMIIVVVIIIISNFCYFHNSVLVRDIQILFLFLKFQFLIFA